MLIGAIRRWQGRLIGAMSRHDDDGPNYEVDEVGDYFAESLGGPMRRRVMLRLMKDYPELVADELRKMGYTVEPPKQ